MILLERSTQRLFTHDHEEPEMYIGTSDLKDLFENGIDTACAMIYVEDQKILDYAQKIYDSWKNDQ